MLHLEPQTHAKHRTFGGHERYVVCLLSVLTVAGRDGILLTVQATEAPWAMSAPGVLASLLAPDDSPCWLPFRFLFSRGALLL